MKKNICSLLIAIAFPAIVNALGEPGVLTSNEPNNVIICDNDGGGEDHSFSMVELKKADDKTNTVWVGLVGSVDYRSYLITAMPKNALYYPCKASQAVTVNSFIDGSYFVYRSFSDNNPYGGFACFCKIASPWLTTCRLHTGDYTAFCKIDGELHTVSRNTATMCGSSCR